MMRKMLFTFLMLFSFLSAETKAVIFDWGDVLATHHNAVIVKFLCQTLQLSSRDFKKANQEKRKARLGGQPEVAFWMQFAKAKGVVLPQTWEQSYKTALKESIGADPIMLSLVDLLKENRVQVGLLSNIGEETAEQIRYCGFYDAFDPCLLSCEMGTKKPHPQAFKMLLDSLSISADEVVFIDNKIANVKAAKKLGIDAVVFRSSKQIKKELQNRALL